MTARADPAGALADALAARGAADVDVAFVLGSGLGAFADELEGARAIPFADLVGMPRSTVPGHAGRFVVGTLGGARVLCQQGRVHLYEGWGAEVVTRAVRAVARIGCPRVVLTNAAGGLVPDWPVPCLMRVEDHLNLQGRTPLAAGERGVGSPYDAELGALVDAAAEEAGVPLRRGTYAGVLGPSYETPAEVRHLAAIGAHAVGMSTVCEAVAAHAAGARVAALSCISNLGAGITGAPLDHDEVVEAGRTIAGDFRRVLEAVAALAHSPAE